MYHVLINSKEKIVKTNLAPFIVNNFYCNYLSGNYMENNLLYIITLMLKDEINGLENINDVDKFLENTKCGFLLEELQKMPDVQIYFKNVILKTVEKIERTCSFREIKFNIIEKEKELIKIKEDEEKKIGKKLEKNLYEFYNNIIMNRIFEQNITLSKEQNNKKIKEQNNNFVKKYLYDITVNELSLLSNKAKEENKNDLSAYYSQLEKDFKINSSLYSLKTLTDNITKSSIPSNIITFYQGDCIEIISFLEQLINDLMKNILLLPNSIKYICKIISILIKKKFPNISKTEENAFISRFLLGKLLLPIISLPSITALISEFVISGFTLKNIKTINYILNKLFSGKLFSNNQNEVYYIIFNRFILNKMEQILFFFEKATKVNLPSFINKCVNGQLMIIYMIISMKTMNKYMLIFLYALILKISNIY